MASKRYRIMLSSTFLDLEEHRNTAINALRRHNLELIAMEDTPLSAEHDVIDASLAKVDAADAFLCLVGKKYGAIHECAKRNPHRLSTTALEFQRAKDRDLPIVSILFTPDYALPDYMVDYDPEFREKLKEFRAQLRHHHVAGQVSNETQFVDAAHTGALELKEALKLRDAIRGSDVANKPDETNDRHQKNTYVPEPPEFYFVTPFAMGMPFVGRERELDELTDWARSNDPMIVVEAIGGMGKSALAHQWAMEHAPNALPDLVGRFWYSFYEEGANMRDFCEKALTYTERVKPSELKALSRSELRARLVQRLSSAPWLFVLDGLERVLVAYNRFDASQMTDEEADAVRGDGKDPNLCIHPQDDELLNNLSTAHPSRILVTSRIMPTALRLSGGVLLRNGVSPLPLTGLAGDDAERLMRRVGVTGDGAAMRRFLDRNFGGHPLMVGVVAGLVMNHFPAPGDFDHWQADPQGADALDLSSIDGLVGKRNHVLKTAFLGLDPDTKKLIGRLAFFSSAVDYSTLATLNPKLPPRPEPVNKPEKLPWVEEEDFRVEMDAYDRYRAELAAWNEEVESGKAERWLRYTLNSLQRRGLLIREASVASFDLHPLVRGFVRSSLSSSDKASTGKELADFARQKAPPTVSETSGSEEIAHYFEVVRLLLLGGHIYEAAQMAEVGVYPALLRNNQLRLHFDLISAFFTRDFSAARPQVPESSIRPLASAAGLSAASIGQREVQNAAQLLVLKRRMEDKDLPRHWRSSLTNFASSEHKLGRVASARRIFDLAGQISIPKSDTKELSNHQHAAWMFESQLGNLDWRAYAPLASLENPDEFKGDRVRIPYLWSEMIELHAYLECLTEDTVRKVLAREDVQATPPTKRSILVEQARLLQEQKDYARAKEVFSSAIQLYRAADVPSDAIEAEYAVVLAQLGDVDLAREQAERLSDLREPPHLSLGELWLALGEVEMAREQALLAYPLAWCDGPPNAKHWDLKRCVALLEAVDEPQPNLPITRPEDLPPFEFEEVLLKLIEKEGRESSQRQS